MSVQMMMAGIAATAMTMGVAGVGAGAKAVSQTADAASAAPTVKKASSKTKYCIMMTSTGSRMERKVCRTRSEWLAEGFDPHAET